MWTLKVGTNDGYTVTFNCTSLEDASATLVLARGMGFKFINMYRS